MFKKINPVLTFLPVLLGFYFSMSLSSVSASDVKKPVSKKCTEKELELKSCFLNYYGYEIFITKEKFRVHNGIRRVLTKLPTSEEKADWHQIKLSKYSGRVFLEIKIWENPAGPLALQDLTWTVYELLPEPGDLKVAQKLQNRIGRRRKDLPNKFLEPDRQIAYVYDKIFKHGLKSEKNSVVWTYRGSKGEL